MSSASLVLTIPLAVVLAVLAAAAGTAALRGFSGTLTRSGRLGVHSAGAMASDEAFTLANRVAAPVVAAAAGIAGVLAILLLVVPMPTAMTIMVAGLGLVAAITLLVVGGLLGERSARSVPVPARRPAAAGAGCGGCGCGAGGCAGIARADGAPAATQGAPASTQGGLAE